MNAILRKIRLSLPKHIPLTADIHKWQEGDELLGAKYLDTNEPAYITPVDSVIGKVIKSTLPNRRPIPLEVLDHQAWEIATIGMDEVEKIQTFGEELYRKMTFSENTYTKWLKKQIEQ